MSSSVSTNKRAEQKNQRDEEFHNNMHEIPCPREGLIDHIPPSVTANIHKLIRSSLQFLSFLISLVCYLLCPMRGFRLGITVSNNTTIDKMIPSLLAGVLLVTDTHGLCYLRDMLPHFIISPLCCQATIILPNPHGFSCSLADSNRGILSPDMDLLSSNLDSITIDS